MPLRPGNNSTQNLYVGNTPVQKLYRGSQEIWPQLSSGSLGSSYATVLNPFSRDYVVFDSDIMRGNNNAEVPLSGSATLINGYEPELLAGQSGSETVSELLDLIDANTASFFDDFVVTDPRTPQQIASDYTADSSLPGNVYVNTAEKRLNVRNGATLILSGVDLGDYGIDVREDSQLIVRGLRTQRDITARASAVLDVRGLRADNQYYLSDGAAPAAILQTRDNVRALFMDIGIRRNACDTTKFTGQLTEIVCYRFEAMQSDVEVTIYDPAINYPVGARVWRAGANPTFENKIYTKRTNAPAGTAPTLDQSSPDWSYADYHFDDFQASGQAGGDTRFYLGSIVHDNAFRTAGPTTPFKSVFGTAAFYQQDTAPGDLAIRGVRIRNPFISWIRATSMAGYTTLVTDAFVNPSASVSSAGNIEHERIADLAGAPLTLSFGTAVTGNPIPDLFYTLSALEVASVTSGEELSGTTAPDGTIIEARAVSVDDAGATSTNWQSIATTLNGNWSGVLNTPRSTSWYRAEVRVRGSLTSSTQSINRFGVGLVVYHHRQSNGTRVYGNRGTGPLPDLTGIGNNFQLTRLTDQSGTGPWSANPDGRTVRGPHFISNDEVITNSIVAMAEVFHRNAPGLKVHILGDARAGLSTINTLDDANTDRLFSRTLELLAAATENGEEVGAFIMDHWNGVGSVTGIEQQFFGGATIDGTLIPLSGGLEHSFQEAMPGLVTGRTQILLGSSGDYYSSSSYPSGADDVRDVSKAFVTAYPTRAKRLYDWPMADRFDNADFGQVSNGNHWNTFGEDSPYGAPLYAAGRAVTLLQAAGTLPSAPDTEELVFDNIEIEPSGAHITVWSSAGPVTTIERQEALAEGRAPVNLPYLPGGIPGASEVMGFQFDDFMMPQRVEIVDELGNPASSGRLRVYPDSGTFNVSTRLFQGQGHIGTKFADGWTSYNFGREYKVQRHVPIIDIGVQGRIVEHGMFVGSNPNRDWIINEIGVVFQPSEYSLDLRGPISPVPIFYASPSGVAYHVRVNPRNTAARISLETTGSQFHNFFVRSTSSIVFNQRYNGASELFNYQPNNLSLAEDDDGFIELLVNVDATNQRFEFYYWDPVTTAWVAHDPNNEWFDNTNWPAGIAYLRADNWVTLNVSSTTIQNFTDFIRIWRGSQGSLTAPPATTPTFALEAKVDGAFDAANFGATGSAGRFDVLDNGLPRTP